MYEKRCGKEKLIRSMENLLQSPTVQKVANRIANGDMPQLRQVGVNMAGNVELGRAAKSRGVVDHANARLESIFESIFHYIK
jgi:hypothetical protein